MVLFLLSEDHVNFLELEGVQQDGVAVTVGGSNGWHHRESSLVT